LLEGWKELPGGTNSGLTVEDALRLATGEPVLYSMLHAVLLRMSKDGKMPGVRQVGNRIRAMRSQPVGGLRFQKCGERHHAVLWKVVRV
jgi:hypothetical protein